MRPPDRLPGRGTTPQYPLHDVGSSARDGTITVAQHYRFHRIRAKPLAWKAVAVGLIEAGTAVLAPAGGAVYGVWRSQIGRPRDEITAITVWSATRDADAALGFLDADDNVCAHQSRPMTPTLRPTTDEPPRRQGNYAFRLFETPAAHYDEFLALCAAGWPGFEAAYDSQVIGLWRFEDRDDDRIDTLLLTRRPDLAMWERSKLPAGEAEAEVRRTLSRRYDLCTDTVVSTATLIGAADREDTARWT